MTTIKKKSNLPSYYSIINNIFTLILLLFIPILPAHSSHPSSADYLRYHNEVKPISSISDKYGIELDLYSGAVSFSRRDVAIEIGKINYSYELKVDTNFPELKGWKENIPRIEFDYPWERTPAHHFYPDAVITNKLCSGSYRANHSRPSNPRYHAKLPKNFYSAPRVIVPSEIDETLFLNSNSSTQNNNRFISNSGWSGGCVNNADGSEGIYIIDSNGTKYEFNHVSNITWSPFESYPYASSALLETADTYHLYSAVKIKSMLLVTKITDIFNNSLTFNYSDSQNSRYLFKGHTMASLDSVESSDGQYIRLNKNVTEDTLVNVVNVNGQVFKYELLNNSNSSTPVTHSNKLKVTTPDQRTVNYNIANPTAEIPDTDGEVPSIPGKSSSYTLPSPDHSTLKTPQGAAACYLDYAFPEDGKMSIEDSNGITIDFNFQLTRRDQANLRGEKHPTKTICLNSYALQSMRVKQSGKIDDLTTYEYSSSEGWFEVNNGLGEKNRLVDLPEGLDPYLTSSVKITEPDNDITTYFLNRDAQSAMNGRILAVEKDNSLIQYTFIKKSPIGDFNTIYSTDNRVRPYLKDRFYLVSRKAHIDGDSFVTSNLQLNLYGIPTLIKEAGPSGILYRKVDFIHDYGKNILNQFREEKISSSGNNYTSIRRLEYSKFSSNNGSYYDLMLPSSEYTYNSLAKEFKSYDNLGHIQRIEFPVERAFGTGKRFIEYSGFHRGVPRKITKPSRYGSENIYSSRSINERGLIIRETDFNNVTTHYTYDEMNRIATIDIENDPAFGNWLDTLFEWDINANIRTIKRCTLDSTRSTCIDSSQLVTTEYYDGLSRLLSLKHEDINNKVSNIRYQNFQYDHNNQNTFTSRVSDSIIETRGTNFIYDNLNRIKTESTTGLGEINYSYLDDNKIARTDAERNVTTTKYLSYGSKGFQQAINIKSPEQTVTDIEIDFLGLTKSITQSGVNDSNVHISAAEIRKYDANKQLCLVMRKDVGNTLYHFNKLGELQWLKTGVTNTSCSSTMPVGSTIFEYDNHGGAFSVNYPDNSSDIEYTYDNEGNLTKLIAGTIKNEYVYNNQGLLEEERLYIANNSPLTLGYSYDGLHNLSSITYPDGLKVDYKPNGFGEATEARIYTDTKDYIFATNATYYSNGLLKKFTYGNGIVHSLTLDNVNQLPSTLKDSSINGGSIVDWSYKYDNNTNLIRLSNNINEAFSLTRLSYDGQDRLINVVGGTGIGNSSIRYDGLGNITYYSSKNRALVYTYDYNKNRLSRVVGVKNKYNIINYDSRGNVTHNDAYSLNFNAANQLHKANGNSYLYDGYSRRVQQVKKNETSYSMYNKNGKLLYSEKNYLTGNGLNYIYLGQKLIAKFGESEQLLDSSGTQHYRPFGETVEPPKNDIGFTGHKFDTDLNLSYMQARYYDPVIGRFYSNDPVGFTGSPNSFNRYAYANNNPYKYIDPDGNSPISVLAKQAAKVGIKQGIQNMGRRQMRRLGRYMSQSQRKEFMSNIADVLGSLDSSPLEIAFELIPVVGDIYGAGKFGNQVASAYDKMQNLENKWAGKIYDSLPADQKKKFVIAMRNAGVRDAKQDSGYPRTGSGLEGHHIDPVSKNKSTMSDPRNIDMLTPEAHKEIHRRGL